MKEAGEKIGRNDPCPCRSGKKYKKCCMGRVTETTAASPSLVASAGASDEQLAIAENYFRQKDAGRSPAQDFFDFAAPLLASSGRTPSGRDAALAVAQVLWNIAITRERPKREAMLDLLLSETADADRAGLEQVARDMLARHRDMFPDLHL